MIYIESKSKNPYFNLALEEYIFENMKQDLEYFMLWQNDNTIVVGKYQNTAQEINQSFVDEKGIKVVRRLSGGGAVYHDKGNLNFTFIVSKSDDFDFNFKKFAEPVVRTLDNMGINAQFTGRNDLVIDGKKFSGNSQYIKRGRIMHHGCIMVDSNLLNVSDALKPKDAKFQSKSTKSVMSRVTSINSESTKRISAEAFKKELLKEVSGRDRNFLRYELTKEDIAAVKKLAREKYETWEWNYGKSGNYNYYKSQRYTFGIVEAAVQVRNGIIQDASLTGDFFGSGEITDVEKALIGLRIDGDLGRNLNEKINIDRYIRGMTAADMQELLR